MACLSVRQYTKAWQFAPPCPNRNRPTPLARELDDVIDAIARLARSEDSPGRFYPALLEQIVSALAAVGGAIWTLGTEGNLQQECLVNPPKPWSCGSLNEAAGHGELIERAVASGEPRLLPPQRKASPGDPWANPSDALLIFCPWHVDHAPAGMIELFQRPARDRGPSTGILSFWRSSRSSPPSSTATAS